MSGANGAGGLRANFERWGWTWPDDLDWRCEECGKPASEAQHKGRDGTLTQGPYNLHQSVCSPECAKARKLRLQQERRTDPERLRRAKIRRLRRLSIEAQLKAALPGTDFRVAVIAGVENADHAKVTFQGGGILEAWIPLDSEELPEVQPLIKVVQAMSGAPRGTWIYRHP